MGSFNLGKSKRNTRVSAKTRVNDGSWHKIRVTRKRRRAVLQVDKKKPVTVTARGGSSVLNTDGKIWIGGKHSLPSGLPYQYYRGFLGCVSAVKIFHNKLNLLRHSDKHDNYNVKLCDRARH